MPRERLSINRGYPSRWRVINGRFYYAVPKGMEHAWDGKQLFKLGDTLTEAYKEWAARLEHQDEIFTIGQLLDRYSLEVIPTKKITTQASNQSALPHLRQAFGHMNLADLEPHMVYKYVDHRSKKVRRDDGKVIGGKVAAHREVEVLSHAFTKAVEWGIVKRHPFKNEVRLEGEKPRDRYIEDWEILEMLSLPSFQKKGSVHAIQSYIRIKMMTGMARSDLLRVMMTDMKDDGIHIQRRKTETTTGKRTVYEWTPELRAAVDLAIKSRPAVSPYLFCKRDGHGYYDEKTGRADGWDSMWGRFVQRVLAETQVSHPFTEHDLRAKCASDAPSLEHARALLSHADSRTTERIYRRKAERVTPLSLPKKQATS